MSQAVEKFHHPGDLEVARAVALFRNSPRLVAGSFAQKDGSIDWGAVELACATALDWNLSPLANAHLLPVINNRVYPMAEVCRTLAARAGWAIDIVEDTVEQCTGVISRRDRQPPPLTITLAEAKKMGSAPTNKNYETDARAMLRAKVSRRLVTLYCPEVLAGTPPDRVAWDNENADPARRAVGEVPGEARLVPPRSVAPDGTTIPEHLREPEIDEAVRLGLIRRIEALDELRRAELNRVWFEELRCPNPKTARATRAHGALLARLLNELAAAAVPAEVYDDSPESRNYDEEQPASYEDPGRPFE